MSQGAYPAWNNTVESIKARIAQGERITVHAKINPRRAFALKVGDFVEGKRMVWTGGMPLGLFKGERTFTLSPRPDGQIEFAMGEKYSGLLAPLITRSITDLQPAFEEFAKDLKQAAETI